MAQELVDTIMLMPNLEALVIYSPYTFNAKIRKPFFHDEGGVPALQRRVNIVIIDTVDWFAMSEDPNTKNFFELGYYPPMTWICRRLEDGTL